jgi:hypothetical protein
MRLVAACLPAQVQGPGSFVAVEGSKLYYEECGTGSPALILIHDGIAHSAVWDAVWPAFCKQYHVLRYDRHGYGRSPAALKLYSEIDDLAALLRERRVGRAILVGAVAGGLPYSDHFITRNIANSAPFEKGDVPGGRFEERPSNKEDLHRTTD